MNFGEHAWVEVYADHIAHNVREVRRLVGERRRLMAVVKADGYGHGAVEVARVALGNGANELGVTTLEEALELRSAGIEAPILVFNSLLPGDAPLAVRYKLTVSLFTRELAVALSRAGREQRCPARVHLKVDTGMGRYGLFPEEVVDFVREVRALDFLEIEGIYTQFAAAFKADRSYTYRQFGRFMDAVTALAREGIEIPVKHVANSAAILDLPEMYLDLVRAGSLVYGIYPSGDPGNHPGSGKVNLKPAWALKARVNSVRTLPRGTGVGYGPDYTTPREMVVATLPVGYVDGLGLEPITKTNRLYSLLRALARLVLDGLGLSGPLGLRPANGVVYIRGLPAPIVGRICMQQCMVDVTGIPGVGLGDEVLLTSRKSTTNPRLPRVYLWQGVPYKVRTILGERALGERAMTASRGEEARDQVAARGQVPDRGEKIAATLEPRA